MERISSGTATPVTAHLLSDNPVRFTVVADQRTSVPLQFRVDSDTVALTQGYDLVLAIQEAAPPLIAVTNQTSATSSVIELYAVDATGAIAPFREIGGPATTLSGGVGMAPAANQLLVADRGANAIDFFPASATGNVAPVRRLVGAATQLQSPQHVAVVGSELYVLQGNGTIVVFPSNASGNVAPTRVMSGIPNPQAFAIERGEIYVVSGGPDISVYPATASGAVSPTRTITVAGLSGCLMGMTVHGQEIFVSPTCGSVIGIFVLPTSANGRDRWNRRRTKVLSEPARISGHADRKFFSRRR